jgi:hypothetical protein
MNRGGDSILSVYSDARAEYTKQLCIFLVPAYFQFFIDLLERSKREMSQEPKRVLWQFQNYLNDIHDWNMEKVSQEIHRIHTNCGCDYLEDLLTAVFIAHTKVLTAIRIGQPQKKVEINIPKVDHFLFKVLCESAKLLWGSTYLFRDSIPSVEKQQNYRMIEGMLNEGILQAVRTLVPVKSILKDFVNQDSVSKNTEATEEDSDEEETETETDKKTDNLHAPSVSPLSAPPPSVSVTEDPLSAPSISPPIDSDIETTAPIPPVVSLTSSVVPPPPVMEEVRQDSPAPPQTIVLDDKPSVRFGQFDAVFDSDHPSDSDMIYDPKDSETEEGVPDLEIMEENGIPLSEGLDFDSLDQQEPMGMDSNDYEEL